MSLTLTSGKRDLVIERPWLNAAGFLGYAQGTDDLVDLSGLGALVTPPTSLQPRRHASDTALIHFLGGFLLHTGLPNPGLNAILHRQRSAWRRLPCPLILHLLVRSPAEAAESVHLLEDIEEVGAVEVRLGEVSADEAQATVEACAGQIPIVACLPLDAPGETFSAAARGGASAVSFGPPRGALPSEQGTIIGGRLYGPVIFPLAMEAVTRLRRRLDLPIFAGGGVYRADQADALLHAGASCVILDSVLWTEPERVLSSAAIQG